VLHHRFFFFFFPCLFFAINKDVDDLKPGGSPAFARPEKNMTGHRYCTEMNTASNSRCFV
jgi:hypothetical protein